MEIKFIETNTGKIYEVITDFGNWYFVYPEMHDDNALNYKEIATRYVRRVWIEDVEVTPEMQLRYDKYAMYQIRGWKALNPHLDFGKRNV